MTRRLVIAFGFAILTLAGQDAFGDAPDAGPVASSQPASLPSSMPASMPASQPASQPAPIATKEDCVAHAGSWTVNPQSEGCSVAGIKVGVWESHYPGGAVEESTTWAKGKMNGPYIYYLPNCHVYMRGAYLDNLRDGPWVFYYDNSRKSAEGPMKKGKRDGVWTFYSKDGAKEFEGPFVADAGNGIFTEWFANGSKWRQFELKDGKRTTAEAVACETHAGKWTVEYDASATRVARSPGAARGCGPVTTARPRCAGGPPTSTVWPTGSTRISTPAASSCTAAPTRRASPPDSTTIAPRTASSSSDRRR